MQNPVVQNIYLGSEYPMSRHFYLFYFPFTQSSREIQ